MAKDMSPHRLKEILLQGESSTVEFKRKTSSAKKIAKEITALANTKGGVLIIGVDDNGKVVGVPSEKYEIDMVNEASLFLIEPPIELVVEVINLFGKEIVVAEIPESNHKPHKIWITDEDNKNTLKAYIRMGEKSVLASSEMSRYLRYQNVDNRSELRLIIGDKEKSLFNYLDKYEKATVNDFAHLVNISRRRAERLMIRLVRAGVLQIHSNEAHDYFTLI